MSEKYNFIEIIGQGMYGKVYKAIHKLENKYYAIKSLNFKDIPQKECQNIETEVNLLQELKHPNIVLYKESFIDKNKNLNIVTTFCEGGDLYQKIFKNQKNYFQEKTIINALVQLLLGLSYIHDKKIVHRDIKTKNIFIQNEHTLRIGDFGIAKTFNNNNGINKNKNMKNKNMNLNKMIGTPLYMAPECFKQNKKYSYKSDIWSLGCCIFEMCNLKHAFEGHFFPAVSVKISEGKRDKVNKMYSKELINIVDSMLDLNPRHRPTIASLLENNFMKKNVGEYIKDFIENYRKYDGNEEQVCILKEQAEKFQIFNIKGKIENLNFTHINNNLTINNNHEYDNNNTNIEDKKKIIKENNTELINIIKKNKKQKNEMKESLNINNYISTKIMIPKQQNTIYNNYYSSNITPELNEILKKKLKNKKILNEHERREKHPEKNKSNNANILEFESINEKESIINKRINFFKERCIKALGNNFYNKAYNYLKIMKKNKNENNDIIREHLSNTFGKNNIGYWQLIDQILLLENFLNK